MSLILKKADSRYCRQAETGIYKVSKPNTLAVPHHLLDPFFQLAFGYKNRHPSVSFPPPPALAKKAVKYVGLSYRQQREHAGMRRAEELLKTHFADTCSNRIAPRDKIAAQLPREIMKNMLFEAPKKSALVPY